MSHSAPTIRVLTWNVHGCVGRDGVRDPNRVARVLEAAQPDISALQEIDSRTRAAAHDPFSYFGELFGWTTVSARTLTAKDGHYGHIVLSRWPIESLGEIDLSMRWSEPRKAIIGAIQVPGARVIVIAVHLGLLPFERRRQFARLRERIETIAEGPLIVLGDFNDFPRRLNQHLLSRSLALHFCVFSARLREGCVIYISPGQDFHKHHEPRSSAHNKHLGPTRHRAREVRRCSPSLDRGGLYRRTRSGEITP